MLPRQLQISRTRAQGNRIKSTGLYSEKNFTTEYTEGRVDIDRRHRVQDHYKVNHL